MPKRKVKRTTKSASLKKAELPSITFFGVAFVILALIAFVVYNQMVSNPAPSVKSQADPAQEFCLNHGGTIALAKNADKMQKETCNFPDGRSCDAWAYLRGEATCEK